MPIELNERADEFECEPEPHCDVTAEHLQYLFQKAKVEHPISDDAMDKLQKMDAYLQTTFPSGIRKPYHEADVRLSSRSM